MWNFSSASTLGENIKQLDCADYVTAALVASYLEAAATAFQCVEERHRPSKGVAPSDGAGWHSQGQVTRLGQVTRAEQVPAHGQRERRFVTHHTHRGGCGHCSWRCRTGRDARVTQTVTQVVSEAVESLRLESIIHTELLILGFEFPSSTSINLYTRYDRLRIRFGNPLLDQVSHISVVSLTIQISTG